MSTAATGVTRSIADYATDLRFEDLPDVAVERAKLGVLDTLGVALAGSRHAVGRGISAYVRQACSAGSAWVVGQPFQTAPEWAALANGTMAHALDYDDRGHASTHTLFPALAVARAPHTSGRALLLSYVVGREVRMHLDVEFDTGRFGDEGRGPGARGWHATSTWGSLGATASACKMLGVDAATTQMAFGIAGSLAGGLIANFGTMTKPLHAGNAARNGVLAATLASTGFTADPEILTERRGMVDALCQPGECDATRVPATLRDYLHIERVGIRIKPYPSCTGTHRYIEAVRRLQHERSIPLETIRSIEVTHSESLNRPFPTNALEAKFSGAFAVAATLVDGGITLDNCTDDFLAREDIQSLLRRSRYISRVDGKELFRLALGSGEVVEQPVAALRNLTTWDEVRSKFAACAAPVIGEEHANAAASLVAELDTLDSIQPLLDHLSVASLGARAPQTVA